MAEIKEKGKLHELAHRKTADLKQKIKQNVMRFQNELGPKQI